jgi:lysophospholipase L1-like esterase
MSRAETTRMSCTRKNRSCFAPLAAIAMVMVLIGNSSSLADLAVVAFGDSTTAIRPPEVPKVYAQLIQDELPGLLGQSVTVYNAGVGGNRTDDALARINADVRAHSPGIVIVQFGINDSWVDSYVRGDPSRVAIDAPTQVNHPYAYRGNYTANLINIVTILKGDGARVILMTPNQVKTKALDPECNYFPWQNDLLGSYAQVVRTVASVKNVELLDVWQMYTDYAAISGHSVKDLLGDEGSHPNQLGHRMVADGLEAMIVPEPGTLSLLLAASLGLLAYHCRNRLRVTCMGIDWFYGK